MARKRSISARVSRGSALPAPSSACSRKRSAISPTERPPTAVMPATLVFRLGVGIAEREPVEVVREAALAVEILGEPPLPGGRNVERADERGEQRDVAHADVGLVEPVVDGRLERERERLGVRRRRVGAAEGFDAGLQEFGRAVLALAEDGAEIAVGCGPARLRRGEIVARRRNGEVRAQAQFAATGIRDQIHAPPDVLAGEIEKRLGRLQDRGRDAGVARALIGGDERVRARVFRRLGHSRSFAAILLRLAVYHGFLKLSTNITGRH